MDTIYSDLKPLRHPERLEMLRLRKAPIPVHLQLVLSDLCNQDCSFCAYRMSAGLSRELFVTPETHNPNRKMPTSRALEILVAGKPLGLRAVQFTGGGEPTVHPDHREVFRVAHQMGYECGLVTNGTRLLPEDEFLRMRWVRVSVDAGTAETYAAIRRVDERAWGRVWTRLAAFAAEYQGRLGVGFVVTKENWEEIGACARMCAANGVQNLRVGAVFSSDGIGYYGDLVPRIQSAIEWVRGQVGEKLQVHSMFDRRLGDLMAGHPADAFCGYQYLTTYVGADLGVYRCCNTAYTARGKVGDLREQSFASYLAQLQLDAFDARTCTFCQFRGQNDAINDARVGSSRVDVPPIDDENFV